MEQMFPVKHFVAKQRLTDTFKTPNRVEKLSWWRYELVRKGFYEKSAFLL